MPRRNPSYSRQTERFPGFPSDSSRSRRCSRQCSATRPIDSDFAPCLYQRAAPCYSSAWLRLAAASVRFFTSRPPGTLPRTRLLPIYSIYIEAKAVPVAASSSELASARPTGPELRPRSFTALRIQHSSDRAYLDTRTHSGLIFVHLLEAKK